MEREGGRVRRWTQTRKRVRYSKKLTETICARVAAGELLYAVCAEAGMPTPQTVIKWAKDDAAFGEALDEARRTGGRSAKGGGVWTYCEATANAIFERLCDGESLTAICKDPAMPCHFTVYYWRNRVPDFNAQVELAKRIQAERFCDLGWELAMGATPETAYLTHVRLAHLRWTAGVMAPRDFRPKLVEPAAAAKPTQNVLFRHFMAETDPETGKRRVVTYCPNPFTGQLEKEEPGWVVPGGPETWCMPGGAKGGEPSHVMVSKDEARKRGWRG
jgi:hypothetical protein